MSYSPMQEVFQIYNHRILNEQIPFPVDRSSSKTKTPFQRKQGGICPLHKRG